MISFQIYLHNYALHTQHIYNIRTIVQYRDINIDINIVKKRCLKI